MPDKLITIEAKPRLHLTLIGMNDGGYRINGGAGLAIERPSLKLSFSESDIFHLNDTRQFPLTEKEISRIETILDAEKRHYQLEKYINITISGEMPTHYGFGSGSGIRLACLEALHALNNNIPPKEDLVYSSGRGGTSGVGINTYFEGGFIVDLGTKCKTFFSCPSQLSEERKSLPLLMQRLEMPQWEIGVCIPNNICPKSEEQEVEFFKNTCPISSSEVYKTLYNVIYGLYSAVRENDLESFSSAIKEIQKCAWKYSERTQYGELLVGIENDLYKCGAMTVGMSSLGPSLFFLAKNTEEVVLRMNSMRCPCTLYVTKPANRGRVIIDA